MKKALILLSVCISMILRAGTGNLLTLSTEALRVQIDETGKLTALTDIAENKNYIATAAPSYLLEYQLYGQPINAPTLKPVKMNILSKSANSAKIELEYSKGVKLTVVLEANKKYIKMKLVKAEPMKDISYITWGPFRTTMKGPIAKWLGLTRSEDFTIGVIGLEVNTDGCESRGEWAAICANYNSYGSDIKLYSYDHTRERLLPDTEKNRRLRRAVPIPVTVLGSSVALFGCPVGKNNELDMLENIELAEKLPHPMFKGKWIKRSQDLKVLDLWTGDLNEKNQNEYVKLCKKLGAGSICRFHGYFKNWGHFDIDPAIYPDGIAAVAAGSRAFNKAGTIFSMYTLTCFTQPKTGAEPYIAPVPDPRLQTWHPKTRLLEDITPDQKEITVAKTENIDEVFKEQFKVVRIDNELIKFTDTATEGDSIILKGCKRGSYYTSPAAHRKNSKISCMFLIWYESFFPGTLDMSNEIAHAIAKRAIDSGANKIILDGFLTETGYGNYAKNRFLQEVYSMMKKGKKEMLFVYSPTQTQYSWHHVAYFSWGEYDLAKGFRGTQLDFRLKSQIELQDNLIPNKMGQYYPEKATPEDVEWLMARVAGWDSGIDFSISLDTLKKNPHLDKIAEIVKLWTAAQRSGFFTEKQKMALRQTDTLYKLSRDSHGKYKLAFKGFWQYKGLKIELPSSFKVKPLIENSVAPCSIKWFWTHDPGIYASAGLSDDLIHHVKNGKTSWKVTYPTGSNPGSLIMQFVLRVPEDAACGVKNIKLYENNMSVSLPVTLQPGDYISIPHRMQRAFVYGKDHKVKKEIFIPQSNPYWYLPNIPRGKEVTISVSCDALKNGADPYVITNLRFHNDIK